MRFIYKNKSRGSDRRSRPSSSHSESNGSPRDDNFVFDADRPPNPLETAGIWSRLFFLWAYPLVKLGKERPLEDSDLANLMKQDTSTYQGQHLKRVLLLRKAKDEENHCSHPYYHYNKNYLARALWWDYWKRARRARYLLLTNMAARLIQAIALGRLLEHLEKSGNDSKNGYLWACLLVACGLVNFPSKQQQYFETYRIGMQFRSSLVASIHSKILRLPSVSCNITSGHVTNLASNDVERFVSTAVLANHVVLGPLEAVAILVLGISIIGPVFLSGYVLLCLLVPLQFCLSRKFAFLRGKIANITDVRVSWISQAVHGARIMKQSAYEPLFLDRITRQRADEIAQVQNSSRLKALNEAIYFFSSIVVSFVIFCVHVAVIDGDLTPHQVYTTLTLLNILQFTLTKLIPHAIMGLSECYVSSKRLQAFFELPETNNPAQKIETSISENGDGQKEDSLLVLSDVTCYWDMGSLDDSSCKPTKLALSRVNLEFQRGMLYCVIGKIGSSKSALLQAMSGELPVYSGTIQRHFRSIAYATQEPWIMNGTIQENILMGKEMDQEWYDQVVDACALRLDLAQSFLQGDETILGDRGVQCSGGQKARIGLARTFYQREAEVVLLDDPLSAVDATVARTIFCSAIQGLGVERGKCVVLVTHQHQFVGMADDRCILMNQASVASVGASEDCIASIGGALKDVGPAEREGEALEEEPPKPLEQTGTISEETQREERVTGIVKWETWKAYAKASGGYLICVIFFAVFVATQATLLFTVVFLGKWGEAPTEDQNSARWFALVGGTTAALIVLTVLRSELTFFVLIRCSRKLHDNMTRAVLRAKISFFDTNPLGRILNRFSADVGIVDETLPLTIYDFLVGTFMFLGSIATAFVVLPYVLLILPFAIWCFIRFRSIFVATTRELKRLEGLTRSPIYAMLSETMLGISTIRANHAVDYFSNKFAAAHDAHTRAAWAFMASSRWFATSLDLLAFLLLSTATLASILLHQQGWVRIESATLGLALTLLIQVAGTNFPWVVRQSAEVTNQMVSVERILEFGNVEPEAPLELGADKGLDSTWPDKGAIEVTDLAVRFRPELRLALDGISLSVPSAARIGIVGRTGSGKSTIVQCLFRLLEAERGHIKIDGVDIATIGLHRLRKSISVIPQTPTLFSGCSVRENLDLFGIHSDDTIIEALEDAHLTELITSLPLGIDSMVSEGGSNFSVGQRQLLCLARAILNKSKLLILDEATANVDRRTEHLLQESLEKSFGDSTILVVAHRLDTIMGSDSVLVMGNGRVLEYGPPKELLAFRSGAFTAMAENTGYFAD